MNALTVSRLLLLVAVFAVGGCTAKVNYYLMSPVPGNGPDIEVRDPKLGVGPVQLAEYLERPNVVTRSSPTRVEIPREHKWGSALESHFTETLAENLRQRLGLEGVVVYPWQPGTKIDFQLTADVIQFVYQDAAVTLEANWILRNRSTGKLMDGFSRISQPSTDDYDDIVRAMSLALGQMSDQIAKRVRETPGWSGK